VAFREFEVRSQKSNSAMNNPLNISMRLRPVIACGERAVSASARERQQGEMISGDMPQREALAPAVGAPATAVALDLLLLGRSKFLQSLHNIVNQLSGLTEIFRTTCIPSAQEF
jgi:hypothetical protein